MNNDSHSPRPDGAEDLLKIIRALRSVMKYLGVPEGQAHGLSDLRLSGQAPREDAQAC